LSCHFIIWLVAGSGTPFSAPCMSVETNGRGSFSRGRMNVTGEINLIHWGGGGRRWGQPTQLYSSKSYAPETIYPSRSERYNVCSASLFSRTSHRHEAKKRRKYSLQESASASARKTVKKICQVKISKINLLWEAGLYKYKFLKDYKYRKHFKFSSQVNDADFGHTLQQRILYYYSS
jgi:hypothetical protein